MHCTAGHQTQTKDDILKEFHNPSPKGRGWKDPGYHHLIMPNGTIHDLQPIEKIANGVLGYNENSIHISYVGGIDKNGKAIDNRTVQQEASQMYLINKYSKMFPNAVILGHRDFSTDLNGNGKIDTWEFIKQCPCYDVREDLMKKKFNYKPEKIVYKLNKPLIVDMNVLLIQEALYAKGYKISLDKKFGKQTSDAVKEFQKSHNFESTGIVDEKTQELLGLHL